MPVRKTPPFSPPLLVLLAACTHQPPETSVSCSRDYELLKGNWQSASFWNGYTEIEIADSMRCFVNHGYYVGPTVAEEYVVRHDTLFWFDTGPKYRICIRDSAHVSLTDNLGRTHELRRFSPALQLHDWTEAQSAAYKVDFLRRQKAFRL